MRFKDLQIGDVFEFDRTGIPLCSGMARGPWRKTGVRSYERVSDRMDCKVGTVNVEVVLLEVN